MQKLEKLGMKCFWHINQHVEDKNSQQKFLPKSGQDFCYACLTFRYYTRLIIATRTLTGNAMAFQFCEKFPLVNI